MAFVNMPSNMRFFTCVVLASVFIIQSAAQTGPGIHSKVREGGSAGLYVGNIATDANYTRRFSDPVLQQLRYNFLTQGYPGTRYFRLDNQTGVIRTSETINREEVCADDLSVRCLVDLAVSVKNVPVQYVEIIKVQVEIEDTNDNSPSFPSDSLDFEVSESVSVNHTLFTNGATDPDFGTNSVQHYELLPQNSAFGLVQQTTVDGATELGLRVLQPLDRETTDSYSLTIIARDGGVPVRSGTVRISIQVRDINDNTPVFDQVDGYEKSITETAGPNFSVLTVHASDPDEGTNGEIAYSFSSGTSAKIRALFDINSNGLITLKGNVVYDDSPYQFTVYATDQGTPEARSSRTTVTVNVVDVNDNEPLININIISSSPEPQYAGHAVMWESEGAGKYVAHMAVSDADSGPNGQTKCELATQDFRLVKYPNDDNMYKILLDTDLNREERSEYNVTVNCWDEGSPPLRSSASFLAIVLDENDNDPVFSHQIYGAQIEENNAVGALLVTVNATDADIGNNALINFQLSSGAGGLVTLDPSTGEIRAKKQFDRETTPSFEFHVIAADSGSSANTATATVSVTVLDQNDESPVFKGSNLPYEFRIKENQTRYQYVGEVFAEDRDEGSSGQVWYGLDPNSEGAELFTIEPNTGRITTNQSLDRERKGSYRLVVIARDRGTTVQSTAIEAEVILLDINDNPPNIIYPYGDNNTVSLSYGTPVGITAATIVAEDIDSGVNAELVYSLDKPDSHNIFRIDPATGDIIISREMRLDDITKSRSRPYRLVVAVTDQGTPSNQVLVDFYIHVTNDPYVPLVGPNKSQMGEGLGQNLIIVIVLATVSAILAIILVIAIIMIKRQNKDNHAYNCRTEAQRALNGSKRSFGSNNSNNNDFKPEESGQCVMREQQLTPRSESSLLGRPDGQEMRQSPGGGTLSGTEISTFKSHPSFTSSIDQKTLENPQATSSLLQVTPELIFEYARDKPQELNALALHKVPQKGNRQQQPWVLSQKEKEAQELLDILKKPANQSTSNTDIDSECSGEVSNTDSGRGHSEEETQGMEGQQVRAKKYAPARDPYQPKSILHPNARFHKNRTSTDSGVFMNNNQGNKKNIGRVSQVPPCAIQVVSENNVCNQNIPRVQGSGRQEADDHGKMHTKVHFSSDIDYHSNSGDSNSEHRDSDGFSDSESTGSEYSSGDVEEELNVTAEKINAQNMSTVSAASSCVDPNQLCLDIDQMFFQDMVV
ncbi:protocadherin-1 [Lingula anatina]|uniref:Protocadherin-1 n=1 Tax=Lingula anatina TaxID=7574 RepID=A0A1S3JSL1_LINAN|nr:protocadherin-1 [Lingula anatina]XP_013413110.1 protocadherin-1 [Lingula anatina]XP_013413111.1 protocadherin-1 [Lingula anatina]|eukprot:XP_013413109.1 protocadherin-1 [Lingula anatina]